MFKLTIHNRQSLELDIINEALEVAVNTLDEGITFKLSISPFILPPIPDMEFQEIETQRTGIDIEKFDKTNPELFVAEVERLIGDGKDFQTISTIGDTAGKMLSECFYHHLQKVRDKISEGIKPSFWNIRLANMCVMYMRCGFESVRVQCDSEHIVDGYVVDASTDGEQVRVLFKMPLLGYDKYKNQRYLAQYTCLWFDLGTGETTIPDTPFTLPDYMYVKRTYEDPALKG